MPRTDGGNRLRCRVSSERDLRDRQAAVSQRAGQPGSIGRVIDGDHRHNAQLGQPRGEGIRVQFGRLAGCLEHQRHVLAGQPRIGQPGEARVDVGDERPVLDTQVARAAQRGLPSRRSYWVPARSPRSISPAIAMTVATERAFTGAGRQSRPPAPLERRGRPSSARRRASRLLSSSSARSTSTTSCCASTACTNMAQKLASPAERPAALRRPGRRRCPGRATRLRREVEDDQRRAGARRARCPPRHSPPRLRRARTGSGR